MSKIKLYCVPTCLYFERRQRSFLDIPFFNSFNTFEIEYMLNPGVYQSLMHHGVAQKASVIILLSTHSEVQNYWHPS